MFKAATDTYNKNTNIVSVGNANIALYSTFTTNLSVVLTMVLVTLVYSNIFFFDKQYKCVFVISLHTHTHTYIFYIIIIVYVCSLK